MRRRPGSPSSRHLPRFTDRRCDRGIARQVPPPKHLIFEAFGAEFARTDAEFVCEITDLNSPNERTTELVNEGANHFEAKYFIYRSAAKPLVQRVRRKLGDLG